MVPGADGSAGGFGIYIPSRASQKEATSFRARMRKHLCHQVPLRGSAQAFVELRAKAQMDAHIIYV